MKKIFITGATGFIGQYLLGSGFASCGNSMMPEIKILSRNPHPNYDTVVCDLQSDSIPEGALDGVDTVFHLAGFAHDLGDTSNIEHLYRVLNVDATQYLLELAVDSGVKRFVFVSSVKAFSQTERIYGQTKREAELKVIEIGRQSGMHVSIVRPALVYGPNVRGNLALMLKGIDKGWFPPLPETGNRRSMVHVDDLVKALFLVAKDDRANGKIFIVTDGVPHSSREIYEAMCNVLGKTVPRWSVPKFLFDWVSFLSPRIRHNIDKLLGDEFYSSAKLEALGFRAERNLKDWVES